MSAINSAREFVGYILSRLYYFSKHSDKCVLSIYFHNPSRELFDDVISWLLEKNYHFISVEELHQLIVNKQLPDRKMVVITFDDGWRGNLNLIASIEKFELPVTLFIATEAIINGNFWWEFAEKKGQEEISAIKSKNDFKKLPGNIFDEKIALLKAHHTLARSCMTLDELKALSRNKFVTIGSHTVSHPILNKNSFDSQRYELSQSKKQLEEWLGKEVKYFAFPNGDFDATTIEIAKNCGYELCFTIAPKLINTKDADPYRLPRYAINDKGGYYENISKVLGVWQKLALK